MDKKIKECLENKHDSYILPFLWLHGEPKERIKEEILAIGWKSVAIWRRRAQSCFRESRGDDGKA